MRITHIARGDQGLCSCAPPSSEIAQSMASAECDTAKEGPLLALDPVVVLDVVRICPEWIHQQERNGINVSPDGPGDVQRRPGYFGRPDGHQPSQSTHKQENGDQGLRGAARTSWKDRRVYGLRRLVTASRVVTTVQNFCNRKPDVLFHALGQ